MSKHVLAVGFITPTTRELHTGYGMALAPRHEHALVQEWSKDMKLTHDQLSQLAALAADAREAADYGSGDEEHEAMTDLLDAVESLLSRAELAEDDAPWEDNGVQFSRLLAEISATQDTLDLEALAESMDLEVAQVNELFDRAQVRWEEAK
jgi:hypothetical protein